MGRMLKAAVSRACSHQLAGAVVTGCHLASAMGAWATLVLTWFVLVKVPLSQYPSKEQKLRGQIIGLARTDPTEKIGS